MNKNEFSKRLYRYITICSSTSEVVFLPLYTSYLQLGGIKGEIITVSIVPARASDVFVT